MPALQELRVPIANGASLSPEVDVREFLVVGVHMPAAWSAANLSFQGRAKSGAYAEVFDDAGAALALTVAVNQFIVLSAAKQAQFAGLAFIKVRSGTSGAPVNQAADRILTLLVSPRLS